MEVDFLFTIVLDLFFSVPLVTVVAFKGVVVLLGVVVGVLVFGVVVVVEVVEVDAFLGLVMVPLAVLLVDFLLLLLSSLSSDVLLRDFVFSPVVVDPPLLVVAVVDEVDVFALDGALRLGAVVVVTGLFFSALINTHIF